MLRSRAEIDQKTRTAQFEIQTFCPGSEAHPNIPGSCDILPFVAWVYTPTLASLCLVCGANGYRITPESASELAALLGRPTIHPFVCERSGRFIE